MKYVPVGALSSKEKEQSLNEVRILRSLAHVGIIKYREAFCVDGVLHICMEYASGGDMKTRIEQQHKKPFLEAQITSWLAQLASALAFIQTKGNTHLDPARLANDPAPRRYPAPRSEDAEHLPYEAPGCQIGYVSNSIYPPFLQIIRISKLIEIAACLAQFHTFICR